MKNILIGNGVNIQFDNKNYTTQQIVLRILKNCDRDDFPKHIIVNESYLLKNHIGVLFLEIPNIINGSYDQYTNCVAEIKSLASFKEQYSNRLNTLKITDIGFEDYYLIHDLVCHKTNTTNPEMYHIRESLKSAYYFAIYNNGELNKLHLQYSDKFINYLKSFDKIFTTNYDSNIDSVVDTEVFHIHGHFDKLSDTYKKDSLRNKLPNPPIENINVDMNYFYLYSNALSTHSGAYKELQINQGSLANSAVEKLAIAYKENEIVRNEVDNWLNDKNIIVSNMGYAVKLKVEHPEVKFSEDYYFDELKSTTGEIEILGLSPWNDFHIFESINNTNIDRCIYYYYSEEQVGKVKELLPNLSAAGKIEFVETKEFWRNQL